MSYFACAHSSVAPSYLVTGTLLAATAVFLVAAYWQAARIVADEPAMSGRQFLSAVGLGTAFVALLSLGLYVAAATGMVQITTVCVPNPILAAVSVILVGSGTVLAFAVHCVRVMQRQQARARQSRHQGLQTFTVR